MDWASWFLLIVCVLYWLFNIKKIYSFLVWSFHENGGVFTSGLLLLAAILLSGIILAFTAPQYGWITRWSLILYIVGFFVYRFTIGFKDN